MSPPRKDTVHGLGTPNIELKFSTHTNGKILSVTFTPLDRCGSANLFEYEGLVFSHLKAIGDRSHAIENLESN
jgi:hypothetical protein